MKQLSFLCFTLFSFIAYSQDLITTKKGEDIQTKVLEINTTEVKYKKADNLEGPIYTILKSDILIIRYANGTKDIFNEEKEIVSPKTENSKGNYMSYRRNRYFLVGENISKDKMIYLLQEDKEAYSYYQRTNRLKIGSDICAVASIIFGTTSIIISLNNISKIREGKGTQSNGLTARATLIAGVACLIPAIILSSASNRNKRRAFETYNRNQERKVTLAPIIGRNSMGVTIKF